MAPTLTWLDSFYHQYNASTFYGTNAGIYDTNSNSAAITFVTGRRPGTFAIQIAEDGVNQTRVGKIWAAGVRTIVESFYFKVSSIPSVDSNLWHAVDASGNFTIAVLATSGFLKWQAVGGAANAKTMSVNVADGLWHRVDLYCNSTTNPGTMDLSFDGVAQAQATGTGTIADITASRLGSATTTHTLTVQIADWVCSQTIADYPIGPHQVNALVPNEDGSHNWASNNMGSAAGGTASTVSTLWQSVDEWPASISDYIQYANTTATATEYAEVRNQDAETGFDVWAARAVAAILSGGTNANSATTRVVDAANATMLNLYVGDQSDSAARYQASLIPSVTNVGTLNGLKWRVGFPTDSNPAPWWASLLIDYAMAEPRYSRKPQTEPLPFIPRGRSM